MWSDNGTAHAPISTTFFLLARRTKFSLLRILFFSPTFTRDWKATKECLSHRGTKICKIRFGYRPACPILSALRRFPVSCLRPIGNRLRIDRELTRNRLKIDSELTRNRLRTAGVGGRFGGYGEGLCSRNECRKPSSEFFRVYFSTPFLPPFFPHSLPPSKRAPFPPLHLPLCPPFLNTPPKLLRN